MVFASWFIFLTTKKYFFQCKTKIQRRELMIESFKNLRDFGKMWQRKNSCQSPNLRTNSHVATEKGNEFPQLIFSFGNIYFGCPRPYHTSSHCEKILSFLIFSWEFCSKRRFASILGLAICSNGVIIANSATLQFALGYKIDYTLRKLDCGLKSDQGRNP